MVKEVIVEYTGPGRSPKLSVFHFSDGGIPATIKTALETFLTSNAGTWSNQYSAKIRPLWREYDTATGVLVSETPFATTPGTITGTIAGQPLPDAVSYLYRWGTGLVVAGRFLKGRTFIPGMATTQVTAGNITGSVQTSLNSIGSTLITTPNAPLCVWSQKHGVSELVTSASVWQELATQRRRRG